MFAIIDSGPGHQGKASGESRRNGYGDEVLVFSIGWKPLLVLLIMFASAFRALLIGVTGEGQSTQPHPKSAVAAVLVHKSRHQSP